MKLNSKNIFARYYNWIYGELPNDVCSFFWGSLFIVLAFPFVVPGRLIFHNKYDTSFGSCFGSGLLAWLFYFASIGIGSEAQQKYFNIDEAHELEFFKSLSLFQVFVIMPLIGGIILAMSAGLIALTVWSYFKLSESRKSTTLRNDWVGAIRRKHCTKIDWE